jgi:hypothetical protein
MQLFVIYNYSFFFPVDLLEKVSTTGTKICVIDTEKFLLRRKLNASCPMHSEKISRLTVVLSSYFEKNDKLNGRFPF